MVHSDWEIAEALKAARRRAEVTQDEAAIASTVPQSTISRWERGDRLDPIIKFARLCEALGLSADDVLGLGGES